MSRCSAGWNGAVALIAQRMRIDRSRCEGEDWYAGIVSFSFLKLTPEQLFYILRHEVRQNAHEEISVCAAIGRAVGAVVTTSCLIATAGCAVSCNKRYSSHDTTWYSQSQKCKAVAKLTCAAASGRP